MFFFFFFRAADTEVPIEMACNREAETPPAITFTSQVRETDLFRLEAPVSCSPRAVDCVVQDRQGRQYDLTPLAKLTGSYSVQDSRLSYGDLHYLINVCRPIDEPAGSSCPGQFFFCGFFFFLRSSIGGG